MSKYKSDEKPHELQLRFRDGSVDLLQIREMSETDFRKRQNAVVGNIGRRGSNSQGRQLRLDKQRDYDFKASIVGWFAEDENGKHTKPVDFMAKGFFEELPSYITFQLSEFIDNLNSSPEDEVEVDEETGEEIVKEDPTSESSGLSVVNG